MAGSFYGLSTGRSPSLHGYLALLMSTVASFRAEPAIIRLSVGGGMAGWKHSPSNSLNGAHEIMLCGLAVTLPLRHPPFLF